MTFDPFMYLSLPLQFASTRSMTIVVFTCDGSAPPTPYTVSVPKQGRCRDLIQALSNACSLRKEERLLIAEVCYKCPVLASIFRCVLSCKQIYIFPALYLQIRNHRIHLILEDPVLQLSTIKDDDHLAVYRLPKLEKRASYIQFVHRREDL